ncbi:hypothetical protein H6798_00810 [Candidatus Nomurabacteria bacterium]|nr:hypothetical protein [Candidatus Nomurabacteria bacterium]
MNIFRNTKWGLGLVVIGLLIATIGASKVRAQQPERLVLNVSPTVIELDANRGNLVSGSFKVVNGSDVSVDLIATPKNFTASDEEGGVDITEQPTQYSLASWINVSPETVEVPSRGSQVFEYTINVPADAEPGGHFGVIIVSTDPQKVDLTGPSVVQEVGPLILVRVPGDTQEKASVVEFSADNFKQSGPIELITRVENQGNVHFKPQGKIEIKNMFGNTVTSIDLEERNVLPGTIRKLVNEWNPGGFTVGRYTANLTIVYGENNQIASASTTFIIFPYKTILPALLGLIVTIVLIVRNRSRIRKALSVLKNG